MLSLSVFLNNKSVLKEIFQSLGELLFHKKMNRIAQDFIKSGG